MKEWLEELRLLGPRRIAFRLGYECYNRTGLRSLFEPVGGGKPDTPLGLTLAEWRRSHPGFLLAPGAVREYGPLLSSLVPPGSLESASRDADEALLGRIRCFSRWVADFGNPVDWHRNPTKMVSWPSREHWSRALSYEPACGDVKLTWELNRFPHVFTWVRMYAVTGDPKYVRGFTGQLRQWEEANPYRGGVNWSSGQELAIRSMAWLFALHAFAEDGSFSEEDFRRFLRLLRLHGEHISANIDFSRLAVHNNHLIGEALALYLIGGCFPQFAEAARWKRTGRALLEGECLRQFHADGGYCQSSHSYHRLALQYYLWACRVAEEWGEPFPRPVYEVLAGSGDYLAAFLSERDGRLPNWGANDGAMLHPWTACDYTDFRPVLGAIRHLARRSRAFPRGPWDEELLWLWGPDALDAPVKPYSRRSTSFPVSGLHVLRGSGEDFAVLRCGDVADRFGQADQLHVDLWRKGVNVAQDGGSYLYNDEIAYHRHFMGTASHNTVTVDGQDQMLLHRRFKWLYWTAAKLTEWEPGADERAVAAGGEHYGYRRLPAGTVVHRRRVSTLPGDGWKVEDILVPEQPGHHEYRLHWLLRDNPYELSQGERNGEWKIRLAAPGGDVELRIFVSGEGGRTVSSPSLTVARGMDGGSPRGWVSRYYGERVPALSVAATVCSDGVVRFVTEVGFLDEGAAF